MLSGMLITICLIICAGAASSALLMNDKQERQAQAKETYRLIYLRNGVNAEIPFMGPRSAINSPGLVEVHPNSCAPDHTPTVLAASTAPVLAPAQLKPLPTEQRRADDEPTTTTATKPIEPDEVRWGYPKGRFSSEDISSAALDAICSLIEDGEKRKTVISWAVFGSNGGSIYAAVRPTIIKALENAK